MERRIEDLTTEELISRYMLSHVVVDGKDMVKSLRADLVKKDNAVDILKARKQEVIDFLDAKKREEERKAREWEEKLDAIQGLKEIQEAQNAEREWWYKFNKSFEGDYGGQGVGPKPDVDIKALREKYPVADAYLIAQAKADSANDEISSIGHRAVKKIVETQDYVAALADMEKDMDEFVKRHIWD